MMSNSHTIYYLAPVAAFLVCLVGTPVIRQIARSKGWLARPSKDRWHKKPTALMGGIAIFAGLAVPLFYIADFDSFWRAMVLSGTATPPLNAMIAVGMTLIFLLGLADDFITIKPHTKLMGQILVASLVAFLGFRLEWFTSLTLDTMVTIIWIVGITNAFNLLDNMDGLCAGVGLVSAVVMGVVYWGILPEAALIAFILAGTLAAFLVYNFNPASIFMGDCGSLVIGFVISLLTLYYSETGAGHALAVFAVPIMIVMVPILDTTLVSLIRILSGRKASTGGRDHTSHRLVLMGLSERSAVMILCSIGAISGVSAWFVSRNDTLTSPTVIIPLAVSVILLGAYLSQLRVYPEKEFSRLRGHTFTPVLVDLTYKRQMLLVMMDFFLIAFSYYLSYRLRFDAAEFPRYFEVFLNSLPAVIVCKFIAFFSLGVYRSIWQYMSTSDVNVYLKASLAATALSVAVVTFVYRFEDFSKGIFLIDWLLTGFFLLGTRGFFRITGDIMKRKNLNGDSILIYGAGRGGEILLREILNNRLLELKPLGFIDDDPLKIGKKLQGYPVLGSFSDLKSIVEKHAVKGLLVSFKREGEDRITELKQFCREYDLTLRQFFICVETMDLDDKKQVRIV
jgi:UDP-GlcNAc:undecaprenyl-phosphate/decaprenyl-phosphate GlcNAc-1-phosphate transferase